jgi:histone H3/H4
VFRRAVRDGPAAGGSRKKGGEQKGAGMGDADRLPMANVSRIVQGALPKDAAIAKEARVALSACATVFVHYITEL